MAGVFVHDMEMPDTCVECPFMDKITEILVGDGLYKKVSRCVFSSKHNIDDPYHDMFWLARNKEPWCPLAAADDMHGIIEELRHIAASYREVKEQIIERLGYTNDD